MTRGATFGLESTGNPVLDLILGGGLPARSVTVIAGEPGSGKTILSLQALFGAASRGRRCLYLTTLSEPALKLVQYMRGFDFYDSTLLEDKVRFFDVGDAVKNGLVELLDRIIEQVEAFDPQWVVIDSFRVIHDIAAADRRSFVYDLSVQLAARGITSLLLGEYVRDDVALRPEFAIADGIVFMTRDDEGRASVRQLELLKMRGCDYRTGRHSFDITPGGITVYPRVSTATHLADEHDTQDRLQFGVAGLDELLSGGVPRLSATIVRGATGTGKTLLGLHFLLEGCRRGERGILFTHEETPAQLRSIAASLGFDLDAHERDQLLHIEHTSPVELSTDSFLARVRRLIEETGARRAVFDSLTTMALSAQSDQRHRELVYALAKYLRSVGVTSVMTAEMAQALSSSHLAGGGLSLFADNLVQLRYVEIDGHIEKAISIIKARGIPHLLELRCLTVDRGGAQVTGGRFRDLHGVLTGVPARIRGE